MVFENRISSYYNGNIFYYKCSVPNEVVVLYYIIVLCG